MTYAELLKQLEYYGAKIIIRAGQPFLQNTGDEECQHAVSLLMPHLKQHRAEIILRFTQQERAWAIDQMNDADALCAQMRVSGLHPEVRSAADCVVQAYAGFDYEFFSLSIEEFSQTVQRIARE